MVDISPFTTKKGPDPKVIIVHLSYTCYNSVICMWGVFNILILTLHNHCTVLTSTYITLLNLTRIIMILSTKDNCIHFIGAESLWHTFGSLWHTFGSLIGVHIWHYNFNSTLFSVVMFIPAKYIIDDPSLWMYYFSWFNILMNLSWS